MPCPDRSEEVHLPIKRDGSLTTVKKMVIPLGEKGGGEGEEQELQVFCLKNLNCIFWIRCLDNLISLIAFINLMTCVLIIFCHSESAHHCFASGAVYKARQCVCIQHLRSGPGSFAAILVNICIVFKKKMHAVKKKSDKITLNRFAIKKVQLRHWNK